MSPKINKKESFMSKPYTLLSIGAAAGFLVSALAMNVGLPESANAGGGVSKAEVQAIVKEYIAGHGDEIVESVQAAKQRQQMEAVAKVIGGDAPSKGPIDAPVTIVEFSDFQCPFCDRVQPGIAKVREKYGDKVRWVYKNLPLEFHPEAKPAAYAALAAHKQGKFWEYSQILWSKQAALGDKTYVAIAEGLKLDMTKFNADRASEAIKKQVETDIADAQSVGAQGTPHFVINGKGASGALPEEAFVQMIDEELKTAGKK